MPPTCAGLLESRKSWLGTAKIYIPCWKFHMQVVLIYLQPFWRNSLLKCMLQTKIAKKNSLKPAILEVKDHSRSSMLTFLRRSSPVLVVISSMAVPIYNYYFVVVISTVDWGESLILASATDSKMVCRCSKSIKINILFTAMYNIHWRLHNELCGALWRTL